LRAIEFFFNYAQLRKSNICEGNYGLRGAFIPIRTIKEYLIYSIPKVQFFASFLAGSLG